MSEPTRVFLGAVTSEFGTYREKLAQLLRKRQCFVRVQEDFRHEGSRILEKLERYIGESDCVICLVGTRYGAEPFPSTQPRRSFTQWEYYFAWEQNRERRLPVYLFEASTECPRDTDLLQSEEEAALQRKFVQEVVCQGLERQAFRSSEELVEAVLCLSFPREERGRFESLPMQLLALLDQMASATIDLSRRDLPQRHSILQALLDTYRHLGELERNSRTALGWLRTWQGHALAWTVLEKKIKAIGLSLQAFGESLDKSNALLEIYDHKLYCLLNGVLDLKQMNFERISLLDYLLPTVTAEKGCAHVSFATNLPSISLREFDPRHNRQDAVAQAKDRLRTEVIAESRVRTLDVSKPEELEALMNSQDRLIEQLGCSRMKLAEFIRTNVPIERMLN